MTETRDHRCYDQLFIGGHWREPSTRNRIAVISPHSEEPIGEAPAAAPALHHPLLSALVSGTGREPRAKLGWTDVAFFAERGIPAANFGPGDSQLAHTADERVSRDELQAALAVLWKLLSRR